MMKTASRDALEGYAFILPALLLFLAVVLLPMLGIGALSFAKFNLIGSSRWAGFANFARFLADPRIGTIYGNTLRFVLILVPLHLVLGLVLAMGVAGIASSRWKYLFRSVFFFPVLATTASVALAWQYVFSTSFGLANYYLGLVGLPAVPWLSSPTWVYVAVAIFSAWKFVGTPFIYYFIGLQGIPRDLYEAATLDGASATRRFFSITLPMLTPTIFFVLANLVIGATQIFDEPYFITSGGPGDASRTVGLLTYQVAFGFHDLSYGSTIALSLFLVIMTMTLIQFSTQKRWVHYGNE
jgi:multiple sugar transport system permease protein